VAEDAPASPWLARDGWQPRGSKPSAARAEVEGLKGEPLESARQLICKFVEMIKSTL
jgi:hypothetical protein